VATLHITNGDHAGDKLRSFVNGPVTLACDVLHEGPCPPVDGDPWHEVRGRFLASNGNLAAEITAGLARADRTVVEAGARGDQIVMWFEHDLFDQLALIRTLDLVGRVLSNPAHGGSTGPAPHPARASLICIGEFPGIDRFIGLGQLTTGQLATLIGTDVPITAEHYSIASTAWAAFRSPDPRQLLAIPDSPALPFLQVALRRFLAEYPSTANGLSRTEELALRALLDGPATGSALFGASQANEVRPFMGDSPFFDILQRLAAARVPLVTIDAGPGDGDMRQRRIALTSAGRDVLARNKDHVRLNGIDVWRGGVHLTGSNSTQWRWDSQRETLVS
jgi:hypothetical protein